MINRSFINFLFLLIYTDRAKHIPMFFISALMIALFSSVMFISQAIQNDIDQTLDDQADFTLQHYVAGKLLNTPLAWVDEFRQIHGIRTVTPRVYGMHYYDPTEQHFMIVGIDFQDPEISAQIITLVDEIDPDEFFARNSMIIGHGVKHHFDKYHYFDYYIFRPPDRSKKKVYIYDIFPKNSSIVTNDMIIMDIDLARTILGVKEGYSTDIVLRVPNEEEFETIKNKLIVTHFDMRIIQKNDLRRYYENLFNYKGGLFIILYLIAMVFFILIIYQRYSMISILDVKEIALLRSVGWKITDVAILKIAETFIVAISSFFVGIITAYCYVFFADAPLLKEIFLGFNNLSNQMTFAPAVDNGLLMMLFLFFIVPVMASVIIPVWKISILDPAEGMK